MKKIRIFSYSKLEQTDCEKLDTLLRALRKHIDREEWTSEIQALFVTKVLGKMSRIRKSMVLRGELKREGSGFAVSDTSCDIPVNDLDDFVQMVRQLPKDQIERAVAFITEHADGGVVQRNYYRWLGQSFASPLGITCNHCGGTGILR